MRRQSSASPRDPAGRAAQAHPGSRPSAAANPGPRGGPRPKGEPVTDQAKALAFWGRVSTEGQPADDESLVRSALAPRGYSLQDRLPDFSALAYTSSINARRFSASSWSSQSLTREVIMAHGVGQGPAWNWSGHRARAIASVACSCSASVARRTTVIFQTSGSVIAASRSDRSRKSAHSGTSPTPCRNR